MFCAPFAFSKHASYALLTFLLLQNFFDMSPYLHCFLFGPLCGQKCVQASSTEAFSVTKSLPFMCYSLQRNEAAASPISQ